MSSADLPSIEVEKPVWVIGAVVVGTMVTAILRFQLFWYLLQLIQEKVWIPWTVRNRMRKQGHLGPEFKLFGSNTREELPLTKKALSEPLLTSNGMSHDIMPRVLATCGPLDTWRNLYGDKFLFKHMSTVAIYTSDPEAIKEVLTGKVSEFSRSKQAAMSFDLFGKSSLLFAEGEEWARQRRAIRPSFYPERSKKMVEQMASWIKLWLQRLDNLVTDNHKINGGSLEIDISAQFYDLTKDILARSSFGSNFTTGKESFEHQEKHKTLLVQAQRLNSNPLLRWIPTAQKKEINKEKGEVLRCIRDIIKERRKSIQPGNTESYGEDLLGLLLEDRDRRLAEAGRAPGDLEMEDEELTDQCRTVFFAGAETTQSALSWVTVLLGHYPDWQERIRAEVQDTFRDSPPNGDQLTKLKQLEMFVEESMRLYNPVPWVQRQVLKHNTTLQGEPLPKHLLIFINILGAHRDKEYWGDDALEFNPERFANGIAKACKKPFAYVPFGGGPRICVAESLALTGVKLILAMLVQRFSFRLSPSYRHEPMFRMTMQPKFGVQVVLEPVKPKSA